MDQQGTNESRYVFDASSLINLERQNKLWHLSEHGDLIVIHHRIAKEVTKNPRSDLAEWLAKHPDRITYTFLSQEGELYISLRQQRTPKIQDPDAIAIAIAWHRKGILVCDDNPARQKAKRHGVTCLTVDRFVQKLEPRMF
jgi:predicted nucleic acid-binding protein